MGIDRRKASKRNKKRKLAKIIRKDNMKIIKITRIILILVIVFALFSVIRIVKNKRLESKNLKQEREVSNIVKETEEQTAKSITDAENETRDTVSYFSFLGDINFPNDVKLYGKDYDYIFKDISKKIEQSDYNIAFLNTKVEKDDEKNFIKMASKNNINYFLANNNTDKKTIANFKKENINLIQEQTDDSEEHKNIDIVSRKDSKFALINLECSKNGDKFYDEDKIKSYLEYAKQNSNFSICLVKWDKNQTKDNKKNFGTFLIQNGAMAVIGNDEKMIDSDISKNMEMIKNDEGQDRLLVYSIGSLVPEKIDKNTNSYILNLKIYTDKEKKSSIKEISYTPIYFTDLGKEKEEYRFQIKR